MGPPQAGLSFRGQRPEASRDFQKPSEASRASATGSCPFGFSGFWSQICWQRAWSDENLAVGEQGQDLEGQGQGSKKRTLWRPKGFGLLILGRPDGLFASELPGPPRSPHLPAALELRRQPEGFWLRSGLAPCSTVPGSLSLGFRI